jgi:putative SOS response-associated peptidase YedK
MTVVEFLRMTVARQLLRLVRSVSGATPLARQACINAKAETLEQRAAFREAFQQRRCVVPADGFYEWTGPKGKRQPLWIHPHAGGFWNFQNGRVLAPTSR